MVRGWGECKVIIILLKWIKYSKTLTLTQPSNINTHSPNLIAFPKSSPSTLASYSVTQSITMIRVRFKNLDLLHSGMVLNTISSSLPKLVLVHSSTQSRIKSSLPKDWVLELVEKYIMYNVQDIKINSYIDA